MCYENVHLPNCYSTVLKRFWHTRQTGGAIFISRALSLKIRFFTSFRMTYKVRRTMPPQSFLTSTQKLRCPRRITLRDGGSSLSVRPLKAVGWMVIQAKVSVATWYKKQRSGYFEQPDRV